MILKREIGKKPSLGYHECMKMAIYRTPSYAVSPHTP